MDSSLNVLVGMVFLKLPSVQLDESSISHSQSDPLHGGVFFRCKLEFMFFPTLCYFIFSSIFAVLRIEQGLFVHVRNCTTEPPPGPCSVPITRQSLAELPRLDLNLLTL